MARRRRIARLLASEPGRRAALALGLVVSIPALFVGLLHDDLMHRALLEGRIPGLPPQPLGLYDFTGGDGTLRMLLDAGYMPWWTSEDLTLRFFRPLSSLSLSLDHWLFDRAALPAHLHTLGWFVALSGFSSALLRRVLRPSAATVATAIYALAGAHVMTTTWLAARHSLIGATFGAIALWAHVSWRQEGERWRGILAPVSLVLGMLSSETALGASVFIVLFEALTERGRSRWWAAAPTVLLSIGHLAFYVTSGYGAHHSGIYVAPTDDPVGFARAAVERVPVLLGELYGGLPSFLWGAAEPLRPILAGWGVALSIGVLVLLWRARTRLRPRELRVLSWLGLSSVVCLLPMAGGVLGGRLLPVALIGSSALVATAMVQTWTRDPDAPDAGLRLRRAVVVGLALLHVALPVAVRSSFAGIFERLSAGEARVATEADMRACEGRQYAYVLTGADPAIGMYAGSSFALFAPDAIAHLRRFRVLSMVAQPQTLRVIDEHTFELEVEPGDRHANLFERVYRSEPLTTSHVHVTEELSVRPVEVSGDGLWTRARFTVAPSLERACTLRWDGARLRAEPFPDVGEARRVEHAPGPMGL